MNISDDYTINLSNLPSTNFYINTQDPQDVSCALESLTLLTESDIMPNHNGNYLASQETMITQLALNLELDKMLDSLAHLPLADLIQPDCQPPIPMVFPSAPAVILPGASMLHRAHRDVDLVTIGSSLLFRSGYTTELRTLNLSPTTPTYWGNSFNGTQVAPYRSNLQYEEIKQPLPAQKNLFYHLFRAAVDIDKPILVEFDLTHFIELMPEEFKLPFVKKNLEELVFSFILNLDLLQKHMFRRYQRRLRVFVLRQSFIAIANKEPKELVDTANLVNARRPKPPGIEHF